MGPLPGKLVWGLAWEMEIDFELELFIQTKNEK